MLSLNFHKKENSMEKGIDLFLISGFLGSGKTTFLQRMLENFEGKKVGVIINEFGNIGIDGTLIEKDGIRLTEINNGSIFCSCIKGNFVKTLIDFTEEPIDVLFIENSGMADPSNIHQILGELDGYVDRNYVYKGAICIVDCVTFLKHVKVLAPVQNQIATSNFIILNKIDLVNQKAIDEIKDAIKEINSQANIYPAMYSQVPFSVLEEKLLDNGYIGETSNTCYNRLATYSIESQGTFNKEDLETFIRKIGSYILRMKGLAKSNTGWLKLDVVSDLAEITEATLGKRDIIENTKIVIIGKTEEAFKEEIKNAWEQQFHETPCIYE